MSHGREFPPTVPGRQMVTSERQGEGLCGEGRGLGTAETRRKKVRMMLPFAMLREERAGPTLHTRHRVEPSGRRTLSSNRPVPAMFELPRMLTFGDARWCCVEGI